MVPSLLLPRSCLPLAYLDPISEAQGSSSSQLFSAKIEILEKTEPGGSLDQPTVLIAESTTESRLWAVERVKREIYALCRLTRWVTKDTLQRGQPVSDNPKPSLKPTYLKEDQPDKDEWWHSAAIRPMPKSEESVNSPWPVERDTELRLCLRRPSGRTSPQSPRDDETASAGVEDAIGALEAMVDEIPQKPDEIFNMIRHHYQEALYASRVRTLYYTFCGTVTDWV